MSRPLVFVFLLALSACAQPVTAPRPSALVTPSGTPGVSRTEQEPRTGAPHASEEVVAVSPAVPTVVAKAGAPKPSAGIGLPASYCRPGFCETPEPRLVSQGVTGTATYYCRPLISRCTVGYPFGMYAAAGPELRAMLGDWRGKTVVVTDANGRGVLVQLIDWCACGGDHVIDLYWTAYQGLVNPVTVTP